MTAVRLEPIDYPDVAGWSHDDHAAAFAVFQKCAEVLGQLDLPPDVFPDWLAAASSASCDLPVDLNTDHARAFFERHFSPYLVKATTADQEGLLTGYFEPELRASMTQSDAFPVPLYARPPDLVDCIRPEERGARNGQMTHARRDDSALVPYWTRAEIERGAIAGYCRVICYLSDPVDTFVLHVQGSGVLSFEDGRRRMRVTYDGKNGHPYVSVGRLLIDEGEFDASELTLDVLLTWLRQHPERARNYIQRNPSFIFFRELSAAGGVESQDALGVHQLPLVSGRSLAVDASYIAIGTPVYVLAPELKFADGHTEARALARLLIASDVGSAIQGPQRGDLFYGTGSEAGLAAGRTKHACRFVVLGPRHDHGSQSV
ncbi:MAG: murein transglycosylase A [Pseudomonadota bacterium]